MSDLVLDLAKLSMTNVQQTDASSSHEMLSTAEGAIYHSSSDTFSTLPRGVWPNLLEPVDSFGHALSPPQAYSSVWSHLPAELKLFIAELSLQDESSFWMSKHQQNIRLTSFDFCRVWERHNRGEFKKQIASMRFSLGPAAAGYFYRPIPRHTSSMITFAAANSLFTSKTLCVDLPHTWQQFHSYIEDFFSAENLDNFPSDSCTETERINKRIKYNLSPAQAKILHNKKKGNLFHLLQVYPQIDELCLNVPNVNLDLKAFVDIIAILHSRPQQRVSIEINTLRSLSRNEHNFFIDHLGSVLCCLSVTDMNIVHISVNHWSKRGDSGYYGDIEPDFRKMQRILKNTIKKPQTTEQFKFTLRKIIKKYGSPQPHERHDRIN